MFYSIRLVVGVFFLIGLFCQPVFGQEELRYECRRCNQLYEFPQEGAPLAAIHCYSALMDELQLMKQSSLRDSLLALSCYRQGHGWASMGELSKALPFYERAVVLAGNSRERYRYKDEWAYAMEVYQGRIYDALHLREEIALELLQDPENGTDRLLAYWCENHIRLAMLHQQIGQQDKAESYFLEAEYLTYELQDDYLSFLFQLNWAFFHAQTDNPRRALAIVVPLQERQEQRFEAKGDNPIELIYARILRAQVLMDLDRSKEALVLLQAVKRMMDSEPTIDQLTRRYLDLVLGNCFVKCEQYGSAVAIYQEAIEELIQYTTNDYSQGQLLYLAEFYERLGLAQWHAAEEQMEGLRNAYQSAESAVQHLSEALSTFWSPEDQRHLVDDYYSVFETFLTIAYELFEQTQDEYYISMALWVMENSRNFRLREQLNRRYLRADRNCETTILQELQETGRQLFLLEYQMSQPLSLGTAKEGAPYADWQELCRLRQAYKEKQERLRATCGQATQLAGQKGVDLRELQGELQTDDGLIHYVTGANHSWVFLITQRGMYWYQLPIDDDLLRNKVQVFQAGLVDPKGAGSSSDTFEQAGQWLYQQLIAPVADILPPHLHLLVDGPLCELSFALLPRGSSRGALVDEYSISYRNALVERNRASSSSRLQASILAVAPNFPAIFLADTRQGQRGSLSAVQREVADIAQFFPTVFLEGEKADKRAFMRLMDQYQVIHLATHAVADQEIGEYSYLAFTGERENDRLALHDIYHVDLSTELVVLSACETGVGEWRRGEGQLSLGRAFAEAGAQATLTTLWKVSDQATARFMPLFYQYLAAGYRKDEALQLAQIDFRSAFPEWSHPYYWAAYKLNGNVQPLSLAVPGKKSRLWMFLLALTFGIAMLTLMARKKKV